ncbi:hypothetical protein ACIBBD_02265 [Streptomyces sp. NPDC051315]|uniref:hypothetical protein n=1 Tax=Streptomyces sp. NPDC051315 TaxID=3365650 RepID=UPI0037AC3352
MNDVVLLLACLAVMCGASALSYRLITGWGSRHNVPAAPDNTPGRDPHLLSACQHIANNDARKEKP